MEERQITLEFQQGNKFTVHYPRIGEFIGIEDMKQRMTAGRYAVMSLNKMETAKCALDLVDAISYFYILIGDQFLQMFGAETPEDLLEMPMDTGKHLREVYREQFLPWFSQFDNLIERPGLREEVQEEQEEKEAEGNGPPPAGEAPSGDRPEDQGAEQKASDLQEAEGPSSRPGSPEGPPEAQGPQQAKDPRKDQGSLGEHGSLDL